MSRNCMGCFDKIITNISWKLADILSVGGGVEWYCRVDVDVIAPTAVWLPPDTVAPMEIVRCAITRIGLVIYEYMHGWVPQIVQRHIYH